jgi:malate permease and related proteins
VLLVALAVVLSTSIGVAAEHRIQAAGTAARWALGVMLYALLPFISFVNFSHLRLNVGASVGLGLAYVAIGLAGALAWAIGRLRLRLPKPAAGAVVLTVVVVNTGYLGLPMSLALLGSRGFGSAVAYDQLVSGPMFLVVGFAIGAAFGERGGDGLAARVRAFVVRNPPLLAVIAGLLTPASAVPTSLLSVSHGVVIALLPLGFFAVGVNLSAERRAEGTRLLEPPDRRVAVAVGLRLLAAPAVLLAVSLAAIRLPSAYLLQAAMPSGVNSLIVGHAYGLDQRLIATVIVWSTAAALVVGVAVALL